MAIVSDGDTLSLASVLAASADVSKHDQFLSMVRSMPRDEEHALLDVPVIVRPSGFELMK
jgi:hypothetical protein